MITQDDMTNLVATTAGISKENAKETVKMLFTAIADDITIDHAGVKLPELGTLRRIATEARAGTNPRTGERIEIKAGYRVQFTAGSRMKGRLGELAPPVFSNG